MIHKSIKVKHPKGKAPEGKVWSKYAYDIHSGHIVYDFLTMKVVKDPKHYAHKERLLNSYKKIGCWVDDIENKR